MDFLPSTAEQRILHAIMVELVDTQYRAICVWPDRQPEKPCAKLPDPSASWLDVKSVDEVYLKTSKDSKRPRAIRDDRQANCALSRLPDRLQRSNRVIRP